MLCQTVFVQLVQVVQFIQVLEHVEQNEQVDILNNSIKEISIVMSILVYASGGL